MGLLTSLLQKIGTVGVRTDGGYMIVDLRDEVIRLPDGKIIRKEDILTIDTQKGVIIYRDRDGSIKEVPYT